MMKARPLFWAVLRMMIVCFVVGDFQVLQAVLITLMALALEIDNYRINMLCILMKDSVQATTDAYRMLAGNADLLKEAAGLKKESWKLIEMGKQLEAAHRELKADETVCADQEDLAYTWWCNVCERCFAASTAILEISTPST